MKPTSRGLTLVELLVAMTIFSVVVTIAISVLLSTQKTQRQLDKKYEINSEVNRVVSKMENKLKSARNLVAGTDTRVKFVDDSGDTIEYSMKNDTLIMNQKPATGLLVDSLRFFYVGCKDKKTDFRLLDENHDGVLADSEVNDLTGIAVSLQFMYFDSMKKLRIRKNFLVMMRNLLVY